MLDLKSGSNSSKEKEGEGEREREGGAVLFMTYPFLSTEEFLVEFKVLRALRFISKVDNMLIKNRLLESKTIMWKFDHQLLMPMITFWLHVCSFSYILINSFIFNLEIISQI